MDVAFRPRFEVISLYDWSRCRRNALSRWVGTNPHSREPARAVTTESMVENALCVKPRLSAIVASHGVGRRTRRHACGCERADEGAGRSASRRHLAMLEQATFFDAQ